MKKVHLSMINLWCNKNLVDSQLFLWKLLSENPDKVEYYTEPYDSHVEIVLLNTCGFISSWREEMFQTIDKLLKAKKRICLIGCGVQYFEKVLKKISFKEPHPSPLKTSPKSSPDREDLWDLQSPGEGTEKRDDESLLLIGGDWEEVLKQELKTREKIISNEHISYLSWNDLTFANIESLTKRSQNFDDFCRYSAPRLLTNYENRYEYLKIAEWCNNSCAFCIIPQIRWKLTSLPIQSILSEAENLLKQWIEELIIVAQDTMRYWTDFSSKSQLLPLLHELDKLPYDFEYRILYLYPDILTLKQLEEFASLEKFIPYFDIPLQHISPKLLKSMGRFFDDKMINTLLKWIRSIFPTSFIRTNIIIWFPGETDEDIQLLQSFLNEDYFDNVALFEYHDEPLAKSSTFDNKVPDDIIHSRFNTIRRQVDKLLKAREKKRKWKNQIGFVEGIEQKKNQIFLSIRPEINCPEIDPVDEVELENVIQCFYGEEIEIGSRVEYVV